MPSPDRKRGVMSVRFGLVTIVLMMLGMLAGALHAEQMDISLSGKAVARFEDRGIEGLAVEIYRAPAEDAPDYSLSSCALSAEPDTVANTRTNAAGDWQETLTLDPGRAPCVKILYVPPPGNDHVSNHTIAEVAGPQMTTNTVPISTARQAVSFEPVARQHQDTAITMIVLASERYGPTVQAELADILAAEREMGTTLYRTIAATRPEFDTLMQPHLPEGWALQ